MRQFETPHRRGRPGGHRRHVPRGEPLRRSGLVQATADRAFVPDGRRTIVPERRPDLDWRRAGVHENRWFRSEAPRFQLALVPLLSRRSVQEAGPMARPPGSSRRHRVPQTKNFLAASRSRDRRRSRSRCRLRSLEWSIRRVCCRHRDSHSAHSQQHQLTATDVDSSFEWHRSPFVNY